jgi:glycogen synthase
MMQLQLQSNAFHSSNLKQLQKRPSRTSRNTSRCNSSSNDSSAMDEIASLRKANDQLMLQIREVLARKENRALRAQMRASLNTTLIPTPDNKELSAQIAALEAQIKDASSEARKTPLIAQLNILRFGSLSTSTSISSSPTLASLGPSSRVAPTIQELDVNKLNVRLPPQTQLPMKVVMVSSEAAPWSKSGGLGDVMGEGSLPTALALLGHQVMVVSPRYILSEKSEAVFRETKVIDTGVRKKLDFWHGHTVEVGFHHSYRQGVDWVFIDHPYYHRPGKLYGPEEGGTYPDNLERFAALCLAALEAPSIVPLKEMEPMGRPDLFVSNDWHAGLLPVYLKARGYYNWDEPAAPSKKPKCAAILHNIAFQGLFPTSSFDTLGLPGHMYSILDWTDPRPLREDRPHHGQRSLNLLKGLVVSVDSLITVSPSYGYEISLGDVARTVEKPQETQQRSAAEITAVAVEVKSGAGASSSRPEHLSTAPDQSAPLFPVSKGDRLRDRLIQEGTFSPLAAFDRAMEESISRRASESGEGLGQLFRDRSNVLKGILNGIDLSEWNPSTDKHLSMRYGLDDANSFQRVKSKLKMEMQAKLRLPLDPTTPLLAFISRLDYQKGPDILLDCIPKIVEVLGCQVVLLGSGAADFEEQVKQLDVEHPNHARGLASFNIPLAHQLMAAADMLLIPSRFEPCGLTQMQAMRYGTVPVVASTGGLRDSIEAVRPILQSSEEGSSYSRTGSGFSFWPATPSTLYAAVTSAVQLYRTDPECWRELQRRGMSRDSSWDKAAIEYESVFHSLLVKV